MLKIKGKTNMVEEPSHVKQLSLIHVCKIGLKFNSPDLGCDTGLGLEHLGGTSALGVTCKYPTGHTLNNSHLKENPMLI
jgi:hypothetical protein